MAIKSGWKVMQITEGKKKHLLPLRSQNTTVR
jgi:hypothetical protein